MALTEIQCKKAEIKNKSYRLSDSNGLSLFVKSTGKSIGLLDLQLMANVNPNLWVNTLK